ncbi:hypothetical protein COU15_00790 [Candidatus Kaiserbacteria bacterium CG10_big_fil_rev_8_21_14_0_10_45_20]|uniref:PTS EIIA type-4 domain-containing protein n=1 Tax=Candidatus Kaiserbacteria bacterium CG10_big_fil_rev_8_21_14_0_10_45_20 TaxID=1974607 RepID=A0A2H0UG90_9BACT|nr:MAG: hypothetical protein COU15_00790 [Candidatus Kaiserbacteria bacterium CG10_big_fil_rev_8_21_14_0_10_45_20]
MIIDGRALAKERKEEVMKRREKLGPLSLGVILSEGDAVTDSFVRIKKRVAETLSISVVEYPLHKDATTKDVQEAIDSANIHDGVIVQFPLSSGIDSNAVRNYIPKEKDVDVISDTAFALFKEGAYPAVPPVAAALRYIVDTHGVSVQGKEVLVVGQGTLVGKPSAVLFKKMGGHVTVATLGDDVATLARKSDIIILGAGKHRMLTADMIKEEAVILDAGTSEDNGTLVGDADRECHHKASLFTPVPGGVGPIAVVEIFHNVVALHEFSNKP